MWRLICAVVVLCGACQGLNIDLAACGSGKGCFFPTGCNNDNSCPAFVTYADDNNGGIKFEMARTGTGWVGFGMNKNSKNMGPATVLQCVRSDGDVTVKLSYNTANQANVPLTGENNLRAGFTNVVTAYENNQVQCSFTWLRNASKIVSGSDAQNIHDLSTIVEYYLLLAYGDSGPKEFTSSHTSSTRFASSSKLSLLAGGSASGKATTDLMTRLHGAFMVTAWILLASLGIFTARYYKDVWPEIKCCGLAIWFVIHRVCMTFVLLFTIAGFVVIFVEKKKWVDLSTESPTILKAHPIVGCVVTALAIINPIMAMFRPHPGTDNRAIFNWAHWAVGTAAHILAVLTVFAGLNLNSSQNISPEWLTYLLLGFVVFHALADVTLEIHRCQTRKATASDNMEMKPFGASGESQSENTGNAFRKFVFGVYLLVTVAVTAVIVVMLFREGHYP